MTNLISIIIATCNRCEDLKGTLDSLLLQVPYRDFDFEVIVADNNSRDLTKPVVESYIPKFKGRLQYLFEPRQGKSYALNRGVAKAKGQIIAFTDDDVILDKEWLKNLLECFEKNACDGVGGRVLPVFPEGTPQWVKDNAVKMSGGVVIYDYGPEERVHGKNEFQFIGANWAFRREMFEKYGNFREDLGPGQRVMGEDTEFFDRLLDKNKLLYYCGKAVVHHPVDLKRITFQHLAKWNICLGRWSATQEIEKNQKFVCYFGVPRYLLRGIVEDFVCLFPSYFNKTAFLDRFRGFFRKWGMIQEYRHRMSL